MQVARQSTKAVCCMTRWWQCSKETTSLTKKLKLTWKCSNLRTRTSLPWSSQSQRVTALPSSVYSTACQTTIWPLWLTRRTLKTFRDRCRTAKKTSNLVFQPQAWQVHPRASISFTQKWFRWTKSTSSWSVSSASRMMDSSSNSMISSWLPAMSSTWSASQTVIWLDSTSVRTCNSCTKKTSAIWSLT